MVINIYPTPYVCVCWCVCARAHISSAKSIYIYIYIQINNYIKKRLIIQNSVYNMDRFCSFPVLITNSVVDYLELGIQHG